MDALGQHERLDARRILDDLLAEQAAPVVAGRDGLGRYAAASSALLDRDTDMAGMNGRELREDHDSDHDDNDPRDACCDETIFSHDDLLANGFPVALAVPPRFLVPHVVCGIDRRTADHAGFGESTL